MRRFIKTCVQDGGWMEWVLIFAGMLIGLGVKDSSMPLATQFQMVMIQWIVSLTGLLLQERRIAAFWRKRKAFEEGANFVIEELNKGLKKKIMEAGAVVAIPTIDAGHSGGY